MKKISTIFVFILTSLITLYQKTLSPDTGWFRYRHPYGYCQYFPTCSEYSKQALVRYGVFKGLWMSLKRLFSCHPFSKGGIDPVK